MQKSKNPRVMRVGIFNLAPVGGFEPRPADYELPIGGIV